MAKTDKHYEHDPAALVAVVKEAARLTGESARTTQPDSPSRQAAWGLVLDLFVASCSAFFTIRASRMGSLADLCVATNLGEGEQGAASNGRDTASCNMG
jgi:hypothetical protein